MTQDNFTYINSNLRDSSQEVLRLTDIYNQQIERNELQPQMLQLVNEATFTEATTFSNDSLRGMTIEKASMIGSAKKKRGRPCKPKKPEPDDGKKPRKPLKMLTDSERLHVYSLKDSGRTAESVAFSFGTCPTTICKIWKGKVSTRKRGGAVIRKLGQSESNLLYNEIMNNSQIKGHELQKKLEQSELNKKVSVSTINRHLRSEAMENFGFPMFTVKRVRPIQKQRNSIEVKKERLDFIKQYKISNAQGEEFIFIDEVPLKLGTQYRLGRSPSGTICSVKTSRIVESSVTAIVAVNQFIGVVNCVFVKGSVNKDTFILFLLQTIKVIQSNQLTSLLNYRLVMDNVHLHQENDIQKVIQHTQFKLLKTARYSPELHCIEYIFGIWKARIRIPVGMTDADAMLFQFQTSLKTIGPSIVKSCMKYVETIVFALAENEADLQLSNCSVRFKEMFRFPQQEETPNTVEVKDAGDVDEHDLHENDEIQQR